MSTQTIERPSPALIELATAGVDLERERRDAAGDRSACLSRSTGRTRPASAPAAAQSAPPLAGRPPGHSAGGGPSTPWGPPPARRPHGRVVGAGPASHRVPRSPAVHAVSLSDAAPGEVGHRKDYMQTAAPPGRAAPSRRLGENVRYLYYDLGEQEQESCVVAHLRGSAANVLLLDPLNFDRYRLGRPFGYAGGLYTRTPVRLQVPHDGHWYLVIACGGYSHTVQARGIEVLPPEPPTASEAGAESDLQVVPG